MNLFRWMLGLPLAAAVTIGLFTAMSALIAQDPRLAPARAPARIDILAKIAPQPIRPAPPPKPSPAETPPPPDTRWVEPDERTGPRVAPGPIATDFDGAGPDIARGRAPIIKTAPRYPENCRARGAEGEVLVQYDVTARGEVVNARIISSDNSCFNRAAIRAVSGWKYPPKAQRGLVQRFVFSLDQ